MKANYHTHTPRCRHARGSEREYIETAIEAGMTVLGFSDHSPYLFEGGYYSHFRMFPEQVEDYVTTILRLKEEYRRDIEIHVGLEMEYYPKFFEKLIRFLEPYPLEYALLGQHCLGNETDAPWSGTYTEDPAVLSMYVNQVLEAMSVGKWLYLAHPDIINFPTHHPAFAGEMRRLCVAAKERGLPLEINLLGLANGRSYPNRTFLKIAAEVGNEFVLGEDAHWPEGLLQTEAEETARKWAKEMGLKLLESLAPDPRRHLGLR